MNDQQRKSSFACFWHKYLLIVLLIGTNENTFASERRKLQSCTIKSGAEVNSEMFADMRDNIDFEINESELMRGKFQMATKLLDSKEFAASKPQMYEVMRIGAREDLFTKSFLLVNRVAFFINNKEDSFFSLETFNSREYLEGSLHSTQVLDQITDYTKKMRKKIKITKWYLRPITCIIGDVFDLDFYQTNSIFDGKRWHGKYQSEEFELQGDESELLQNFGRDFGRPSHIVVYDLNFERDLLKGGKTISYFYPLGHEFEDKMLVVTYQVISFNIESEVIKTSMSIGKNLMRESSVRETALLIDFLRSKNH